MRYLVASDFLGELEERIVLVKSDFNVPFSFRIRQAAPFIKKLLDARVVPLIATHLGRPKGDDSSLTLDVIVKPLSEALGKDVQIIRFDPNNMTYPSLAREHLYGLFNAGIVPMLDNIRFHTDEIKNHGGLARILAATVHVSIQNSFGTAHRVEDTSNHIHQFVPGFAGDLLIQEIIGHREIKQANSPYIVIVGGDKVEDTLQLMRGLFRAETTTHWGNSANYELNLRIGKKLVDYILVGGHLMYAFVYAQLQMLDQATLKEVDPQMRKDLRGLRDLHLKGYEPTHEEIRLAKGLLRLYNNFQFKDENPLRGRRLVIPVDYTVKRSGHTIKSVRLNDLLDGDEIIDIGQETQELYSRVVKGAKTIVWNGPLGLDDGHYVEGTRRLIETINATKAVKEIGGGSTNYVVSAYEHDTGKSFDVGFRSTGGGSTLLEVAHDSPTTISLMMSRRRLIEGGYGPKYEGLRKDAIQKADV